MCIKKAGLIQTRFFVGDDRCGAAEGSEPTSLETIGLEPTTSTMPL